MLKAETVVGTLSIQVILPTLIEEEDVGPTIADLQAHLNEPRVLVVDGRSIDRTVEFAMEMGADIVFQDRIGKGDALAKAIQCSDLDVDYVVITDADYTYP